MATLTIRKLDDAVYDRLRAAARRNDRSIEAEARHTLNEALPLEDAERAARVEAMIERLRTHAIPIPLGMDSVSLIRAVRDEE